MNKWSGEHKNWMGKPKKRKPPPPKPAAGKEPDYAVIFTPLRCPKCASKKVPCYSSSSESKVRYHRCTDCGYSFKSIEEKPTEREGT